MLTTENDKNDAMVLAKNMLLDQACRLMAIAKDKQTNRDAVIYVDTDGNDAIAYVYGYKTVTMTTATTFDKIAQDAFGDPSLGTLIAYYNKIQLEHKVIAGTDIKIPILTSDDKNERNRIYAVPELQDNYGRDIALTDAGGFAVDHGDLAVVKGTKNLHQAIGNRLTTASQNRIRLGSYGIRMAIGDPMAITSYVLASIEQTLKEDPRIERINGIQIECKGDKLYITVSYTDINGTRDSFEGDI